MAEEETDSEVENLFISKNPILFKKYQVIKKLCSGAFGSIFLGLCLSNDSFVAIKAEPRNIPSQHLENEAYFLYMLKGVGIPEVLSYGRTKYYNILVEPFLGKSLYHLYQEYEQHFELKDICLMGIQIIDRLEWIHSKNVIHRDVKPDNFLIGEDNPNILYLIDFGLSSKYRSSVSGKHIKFGITGKLTGTTKYSSANSIRGGEQSRKDDLESAAYMIIFFMKGYLPWQDIESKDEINKFYKIYMMKKNITEKELCEGLPEEIYKFLQYVKGLSFEEKPDYNYLRSLFKIILYKSNIVYNDRITFSWVNKDRTFSMASSNLYKRKSNFHSRLFKQIQKNLEIKENNDYFSTNIKRVNKKSNKNDLINNKNNKLYTLTLNDNKNINNYKGNFNLYNSTVINKRNKFNYRNKINHDNFSDFNYAVNNIDDNRYIILNEKMKIKHNKKNNKNDKRNLSGNPKNYIFNINEVDKEDSIILKNKKLINRENQKPKEKLILNNDIHYKNNNFNNYNNIWSEGNNLNIYKINNNFHKDSIKNAQKMKNLKIFRSYNNFNDLNSDKFNNKSLINSSSKNELNNRIKKNNKIIKNESKNNQRKININKITNIKYITKFENNNYNYYSNIQIQSDNNNKIKNFGIIKNNSKINDNFYLKEFLQRNNK